MILAELVLTPKQIPEISEGSDAGVREARPVPRAALAAFKFKVKPASKFTLVWSNKGSTMREKLSIWAAEVEVGSGAAALVNWKRNSKVRLMLGHYAVAGYDAPSTKNHRVLEITDTAAATLSHSEHLSTVVDQLMPPPLVRAFLPPNHVHDKMHAAVRADVRTGVRAGVTFLWTGR